jgi:hypothetical protein
MSQFLLFVIAVLLFAIFWELCKINGQLKRRLPGTARISARVQANEVEDAKTFV